MLDAWAAQLLGNPTKVRCTVEMLDDAGAVVKTRKLLLSELKLTPDVVFGVEPLPAAGQVSEIEKRVLYTALLGKNGLPQQARLRVQHARPADLGARELTLLDVLEQARRVRRLLTTVRAADSEDLNPPERGAAGETDLTDLNARVTKAERALEAAHNALDTLVKQGAAPGNEALRAALLNLGSFGLQGSVPVIAADGDEAARAALNTQGIALLKESKACLAQVRALIAAPAVAEPRGRREQLLERMRAVFGSSLVAMPRFTYNNTDELNNALAANKQVQGGDPLQVYTWFTRAARVRDPLARWSAPLRGAEVLGTGGV